LPPDPIPDELDDPLRESPVSEYAIGETARRSLLDPAPSIITPILLMVNVGWFVFGGVIAFQYRAISDYLKGSNDPVIGPILRQAGAVSGPDLLNGEWWRLFTCCFVHVGLFHLLCNMVTLALLGSVAEGVWGRWRFSIIYLLSGLAGSVTTMAFHPQMDVAGVSANLLLGGASGNLWGVTTAVIAWLVRNLKHLPPDVGSEWVRKLVVVAVLNGVISLAPGISLEAHLGGGVGGLLVALCLARMRGNRRETTVAAVGLTLLITVFAVMLPLAMNRTGDWQDVKERHNRVKALRAPADARIQPP
jgi:membrane associated rhomboid family serine protease